MNKREHKINDHFAPAGKALAVFLMAASLSMTACGGSASAGTTAAQTAAAAETTAAETTATQTAAAAETTAAETTATQTAAAAETTAGETTAEREALVAIDLVKPDEAYDFWNGDWFGWWEVADPQGDWTQLNDLKMALMGEIKIAKSGKGVLMLWDETAPRDDAMCEINVTVDRSRGSHGTAVSGEGYFLTSDVLEGDWVIDPDKSGYDGMIRIDGTCTEDGNKAFDYHVYLMKWGADWSAVEEKDQPPLLDWYNLYRDKGAEMPHELP